MPLTRSRLQNREVLLGTWLNLGVPCSAEIAGLAGFDWVLIDREHGGGDEKDVAFQIMAAELGGTAAIVRAPGLYPAEIKRALDHGAAGIMIPQVQGPKDAATMVNAVRIAPVGQRGAASSTRASRYGCGYQEYLEQANDRLVTMAQIESVEGVGNSPEIAALDGVDVLFVGPTDLSTSLGAVNATDGGEFWSALRRVRDAARSHGKAAGILARNQRQAERYVEEGYTVIALESDRGLLAKGFKAAVDGFRAGLASVPHTTLHSSEGGRA